MNEDKLKILERLAGLRSSGALTDIEYEQQKAIVLGQKASISTEKSTNWGIWAIVLGIIVFVILIGSGAFDTPTPENEKAKSNPAARFFSGYDGSHRELEEKIKATLNNPESYEHVETKFNDNGTTIYVSTKFRAKNGFDAVVTRSATASLNRQDGTVINWVMLD